MRSLAIRFMKQRLVYLLIARCKFILSKAEGHACLPVGRERPNECSIIAMPLVNKAGSVTRLLQMPVKNRSANQYRDEERGLRDWWWPQTR